MPGIIHSLETPLIQSKLAMIDVYNLDDFFTKQIQTFQPEIADLNQLESFKQLNEEYEPKFKEMANGFCERMMEFGFKRQSIHEEYQQHIGSVQVADVEEMEKVMMRMNDFRRNVICSAFILWSQLKSWVTWYRNMLGLTMQFALDLG